MQKIERFVLLSALSQLFHDEDFAKAFCTGSAWYDENPEDMLIDDDSTLKEFIQSNTSYEWYERDQKIRQFSGIPHQSYRYHIGLVVGMLLAASMDKDPASDDFSVDITPFLALLQAARVV